MKILRKLASVTTVLAVLIMAGVFLAEAAEKPSIYIVSSDNPYQYGGVLPFTSEQEVVLNLSGNFHGEATVTVYEASVDDVLNFLVYSERTNEYGEPERTQINAIPTISADALTEMNVRGTEKFSIPIDRSAIQLVEVRAGDLRNFAFVVRSDVGAVVVEGNNEMIAWVQNLRTGKSIGGAQIDVYNLKDKKVKISTGRTGSDGVVRLPVGQTDVAVVGSGKSRAIVPINLRNLNNSYWGWSPDFAQSKPKFAQFLFLDRPLYKPGDTVYFKSIIRQDDDLRYHIEPNQEWVARIVRGWGDEEVEVAKKQLRTDEFGTVFGEFVLPKDLPTGDDYRLELEKAGKKQSPGTGFWFRSNTATQYFQVAHYRKPAQTLSVNWDKNTIVSGQGATFRIKGKYFSGEPLANEEVNYRITAFNVYDPDYYKWFLQSKDSRFFRSDWEEKEVIAASVKLDDAGEATVDLPVWALSGKLTAYMVQVDFTPRHGEPVRDQEQLLIYPGDYNIYRTDNRYSTLVGESVGMEFVLHPMIPEAQIAQKEFEVNIKRTWWEKAEHDGYKRMERDLPPINVTSNDEGKLTIDFVPSEPGSYSFTINSKNAQHLISKEFSTWVRDKDSVVYDGRNKSLSINIADKIYTPGTKMVLDIVSEIPDRDVFVSLQREFVHDYKVVSLHGKKGRVVFDVQDSAMPRITVAARSFADKYLSDVKEVIDVSANKQRLIINIESDKKLYSAGDEVRLRLRATDVNGVAQKADVAIWAVDKALLELAQKGHNESVFGNFWKHRYGFTQSVHSLQSISITMVEAGGCFAGDTEIMMADGSTKPIKDIRVGDKVLTQGDDQVLISGEVTSTSATSVSGYLLVNGNLRVTDNHLLFVNNKWLRADQMRIGDTLIGDDGKEVIVQTLEYRRKQIEVYNFTVKDTNTYFAGGVWVHNGKGDGAGRSIFKDVAYWNPSVKTDDNGEAVISFTLPDDLTTWAITAIGATVDTKVGDSITEITVGQQYIIRPTLPNIIRHGDTVTVTANVHNLSDQAQDFKVVANAQELEIAQSEQKVHIAAGEYQTLSWTLTPTTGDNVSLRFSMYSSDGDEVLDRITKVIPVEPFGFWERRSVAQFGKNSLYDLHIPSDARNSRSYISLSTAPTLLGSLSSAAQYLIHYPYGCMEQTISRFVPALLAKEHPEVFGDVVAEKDLDAMIARGVARLRAHQNDDGGWGWWSGEKSNLFLSVYIGDYLMRAQAVGADAGDVLNNLRKYLTAMQWTNERKDVVPQVVDHNSSDNALWRAGHVIVGGSQKIDAPITVNDKMPLDVIALAVIANVRNGYTDKTVNGTSVLRKMLTQEGDNAQWLWSDRSQFGTKGDISAFALRAFIVGGGDEEIVRTAVRTLRDTRQTEHWRNTFTTAQVLESFVLFAKKEAHTPRASGAIVSLDGKEIARIAFGDDLTKQTIIDASSLVNNAKITVTSKDNPVYSSLFMKLFRTDRKANAQSNGISVTRTYANADKSKSTIDVGDMVMVTLRVTGLSPSQRYLAVEDQLPAGMVPVNENLANVQQRDASDRRRNPRWVNVEYTKNGAIFSQQDIKGESVVFRYQARVVAGGTFSVPPATAMLMYNPQISARTAVATITLPATTATITGKTGVLSSNYQMIFIGLAVIMGGLLTLFLWRHKSRLRKLLVRMFAR